MKLKLIRYTTRGELIKNLEDRYGSRDNLKTLIKKDPENFLYHLDWETWQHHQENPRALVEESETIFLRNQQIGLHHLNLLKVIKKEKPNSIDNLSSILNQDPEEVKKQVQILAQEGLLKLVPGPDGDEIPLVDFKKIEIEI